MNPPLTERSLHIHCGDNSAGQLRRSGVPGTVIVNHDPVCCGPTPCGVTGAEWYRMRADYLVSTGVPFDAEELARGLESEDARLEALGGHDEVVLWFDHCLFDQSILVRLLDRLAASPPPPPTRLSLICIGEFPGFARFKGLGELSPRQMASLAGRRHAVTPAESSLAARAWAALLAPDPREVERVLAAGTAALPYLGAALERHLEQFPSVKNGLSRTEAECLAAVADGNANLVTLFNAVSDMERHPFMGDTMLWDWVQQLVQAPSPALTVNGPGPIPRWETKDDPAAWTLSLTDTGRKLMDGLADWPDLNGLNRWVGGVHLLGTRPAWRWDGATRSLV